MPGRASIVGFHLRLTHLPNQRLACYNGDVEPPPWPRSDKMKRILHFGFLLMGFTFTVAQGLLIRELLVSFFGNELAIGLILGNWLILEAAGSGLLGRLADRWRGKAASYAGLQVLFALFLPLCLFATYISRSIAGAIPGEGVGLVPIYYTSFLILTPLALVDGAMFAFGARAYAHLISGEAPSPRDSASHEGDKASSIGRVYIYEAIGAIMGGVVFTYLFIPFLFSLQIVLFLSGLNLLSAALILAFQPRTSARSVHLNPGLILVLVLLAASLALLLYPGTEGVQRWAFGRQWPGYQVVYSENSVYGNVTVVHREGQYTFYTDGIPTLTAPVPDVAASEEIVHLPMLFTPDPRRALVLSGGVGGVLRELAKYPLEQIDYAELDPLLIEAVREFPTPLTQEELSDPRVMIEPVDGRLLVRRKRWGLAPSPSEGYDLIIVNLPYPSTLQLNRFYTLEFFQMLGGLLSQDGVVVITSPGTLTYMSQELRDLNSIAYRTLEAAFPHVRPIPGDLTIWLASSSETLSSTTVETLVKRWEERDMEANLVTTPYLQLRFDQRRLDWFWASLKGGDGGGKAVLNKDLHPLGLFYGLSYWNALFSPDLAPFFALAGRLRLWTLALPILGCALLLLVALKLTGKGQSAIIPVAIASTGFTGMTADLIIVFSFQTLYGYVYHRIGLIITAFMAGLSLGGLLMTRRLARMKRDKSTLLKLEVALVLYWAVLPILLLGLYSPIPNPLAFGAVQWILLFLNALAGFLVGSQFPLANRTWLKGREHLSGGAGVLYASDLVGAFLGSILVSVLLIPVLGIVGTCLLAAFLKLGSLALVAALPPWS